MAGSQQDSQRAPFTDPVLAARLEALQLLAERTSQRIMVVDRDLTIVYANQVGWQPGNSSQQARPAKCYEAFLRQGDPCEACPATKTFETGTVHSVSCSMSGDGIACGMRQAFPLLSSRGETDYVLVLFSSSGRDADVTRTQTRAASVAHPSRAAEEGILGGLIGQSLPMRELFGMIRLIADSQATVLLQGESGTGKELVARMIHDLSTRRTCSFVVVDCGSLPETLLETELFGHVKGAFTGAVSSKKGLFEEANGGTIFLDEIVDTSPNFQSKLLRVLQEREIKPVGSSRSIKVDVRVISATNKDMLEQVKARAFREDLYYRLSVLPLFLPALRDRRADIPLLVRHFVAQSCQRHRKPLPTISREAQQGLTEAIWPGNIRELQHLIERVVLTAPGPSLTREDFFGEPAEHVPPSDLRAVASEAKHHAERCRILEALRQASGNRARAARLLKISRASLYNKLRAYNIA